MSVREIIDAAPKMRVHDDCSDCNQADDYGSCGDDDACAECESRMEAQRRFTTTFSPEHVLLMEAVVEEAVKWLCDDLLPPDDPADALDAAVGALINYRTANGVRL